MIRRRAIPVFILLALTLALATPTLAAGPQAELKAHVDQFLALLKDPKYKAANMAAEQTARIWDVVRNAFDFEGVARVALGRHWKDFSDQERRDFTTAFSDLLGSRYIDSIRKGYNNEMVDYLGEEVVDGNKAVVRTKIMRKGAAFPVDYRLWQRGGAWKIYDVIIEGMSLVQNYRSQFDQILFNNPPAVLIQRVKNKQVEENA